MTKREQAIEVVNKTEIPNKWGRVIPEDINLLRQELAKLDNQHVIKLTLNSVKEATITQTRLFYWLNKRNRCKQTPMPLAGCKITRRNKYLFLYKES